MVHVFNVVDRFIFTPAPAERLGAIRLLTGGFALLYLLVRAPHLANYGAMPAHAFHPVGVVAALDSPLPKVAVLLLIATTLVLAVPFFLGWHFRITAPAFFVALLCLLSYANSFGHILHTENLLVLHVAVLSISAAADSLALDCRRSEHNAADHGRYRWPVQLLCVLTACSYFLAGVAKLRFGGLEFLEGETLKNLIAYDSVRKLELGSVHSPFGIMMLGFAPAFSILTWLTLVLELGAPLALLNRRLATGWAIAMWGFHVGVLLLMAIAFTYPLTVGLACYFPAERGLRRVLRIFRVQPR